ncbi:MAG: twin-arginine translocase subunit TatC [Acidaminococcus sp.]|jgi:sec-independent protein translocase protein TatC|nr:twin-arginine translocase subunit TatC [Acidaminococcus sp.]MCI2100984.1 twin-arginine translocase subunit TatC [Acidaminococcus sp.]MCI2115363.1 twin-arginine translocase subunit TatC [Acidaminococcus sp.]MCI2117459.1 twin-arginine translocase subunit TatC [Acidaminococcus sp.]
MNGSEGSFLDHLEALRRTLLSCFAALLVLYPAAYLLTPHLISALIHHAFGSGTQMLHYFGPMDMFRIKLETALILDLMLSFPWMLWQGWKFLMPALYANERRILAGGVLTSSLLFAGGAAFSAICILPLVMQFSFTFASAQVQPMLGITNFLTLAGWLMLAFGVMFQTPLCVLFAVSIGFITTEQLRHLRPYVMTVILILAAILTPPDVFSQLMLAIPTWLLYEGALCVAERIERAQAVPAALKKS